jgi:hypothetical protein
VCYCSTPSLHAARTAQLPTEAQRGVQAPLLAGLSDEQRRHVLGVLKRHTYHSGDFIIRQGELGNDLFMLLEGTAMATTGARVLAQYAPGSCFGEMALLTEGRRLANVMAACDCEVHVVSSRGASTSPHPRQLRRTLRSAPLCLSLSLALSGGDHRQGVHREAHRPAAKRDGQARRGRHGG